MINPPWHDMINGIFPSFKTNNRMKQMEEEYVSRSSKGQKVRAFTFSQHIKVDTYRPPLTFVFAFLW